MARSKHPPITKRTDSTLVGRIAKRMPQPPTPRVLTSAYRYHALLLELEEDARALRLLPLQGVKPLDFIADAVSIPDYDGAVLCELGQGEGYLTVVPDEARGRVEGWLVAKRVDFYTDTADTVCLPVERM